VTPTIIIIGVGNEFRHDDGVGIAVARAVRARVPDGVMVYERGGEGTDLISTWTGADLAIIVDAVSSGKPAGTIHRFEIGADSDAALPTPQVFRGTSHQIGLGEGIALGKLLGMLPRRMIVYGIEGETYGDGVALSEAVGRAVGDVVSRVLTDCQSAS
jgi:hydrogenase maturation protease